MFVYNIENSKSKQLEIPNEMAESIYRHGFYNRPFTLSPNQKIQSKSVNIILKKKSGMKNRSFIQNKPKRVTITVCIKLINGKIYIISSTNNGYTLLIGDLNTGGSLYEGKLHVKNQKEDPQRYRLYFNDINSL